MVRFLGSNMGLSVNCKPYSIAALVLLAIYSSVQEPIPIAVCHNPSANGLLPTWSFREVAMFACFACDQEALKA